MRKLSLLALLFVVFSCATEEETYKMMSYNIRYNNPHDGENQWEKRKMFLCSQIAFYEPDIFGIQEGLFNQVQYIDNAFSDYRYVGVGRDDGKEKGEYSAVFYNSKKFEVLQKSTFWLSETPNEVSVGWDASMERICTYALFRDKRSKRRFWVFNAHFDHVGDKARSESAELIVSKIKELNPESLPVVVMGDFNLKPTAKPIQYLSGVFNDSYKVSRLKPFGPVGTFNGFKFHEPVTDRIDYIFTGKDNIQVNKYAVLSDSKDCRYPSDHLPVFVELKIINP